MLNGLSALSLLRSIMTWRMKSAVRSREAVARLSCVRVGLVWCMTSPDTRRVLEETCD